jgi:hypothetical protein
MEKSKPVYRNVARRLFIVGLNLEGFWWYLLMLRQLSEAEWLIVSLGVKGQFQYFEHWAPFLVCLGWNRVWRRNSEYWSCLKYLAYFKSLMFLIKYRSEIQFLPCFIWYFENEKETGPEPEPVPVLSCSLFAQFSVSTVGLEPSEKTTTPSVSFTKCRFIKCQIKHDRNCISLRYLIKNINEQH